MIVNRLPKTREVNLKAQTKQVPHLLRRLTVRPQIQKEQKLLMKILLKKTQGKGLLMMTGTVANVEAAVEAAADEVKKHGLLVSTTVIARPQRELFEDYL